MHYGNCNAEPTIIRKVLGDNLQNSCYYNLDDKPENVNAAQKMKLSIKDFFSKCEQIRIFWRNPTWKT